jgi:4-diphosphocytidyl-2-C-methyl-D-erythritol kinase
MSAGRSASVAAQAKVNLRLRILATEASGFHQLETLFLRIDLADSVRVRRTDGARTLDVRGDVDLSALGPPESNLAWRAAELYLAATGSEGGFAIEITKRIPIGGGLGGGSADAGAVLRAMDAMADEPLGTDFILMLASQLGSDVPFLASENAYALAWGRGERMLALEPPPQRDALLIVPAFGIKTADAFAWMIEGHVGAFEGGSDAEVVDVSRLSDWDSLRRFATNDFERTIEERHPELSGYLEELKSMDCVLAMLTGSGSTVFGVAGRYLIDPRHESGPGRPRYIRTRTATHVERVAVIR